MFKGVERPQTWEKMRRWLGISTNVYNYDNIQKYLEIGTIQSLNSRKHYLWVDSIEFDELKNY